MEALERKKENQRLLDEENARIKGKAQLEASGKVTRAQIKETLQNEQQQQQQQQQLKPKGKVIIENFTNYLLVIVRIKPLW